MFSDTCITIVFGLRLAYKMTYLPWVSFYYPIFKLAERSTSSYFSLSIFLQYIFPDWYHNYKITVENKTWVDENLFVRLFYLSLLLSGPGKSELLEQTLREALSPFRSHMVRSVVKFTFSCITKCVPFVG